ncbi:TldD/PmbA family protein [Deinococcus sp. QL22]|uniref:TldD/PmbA family protein n=1 Tax=Deinococcus sp. QL22 TaxID=2939437 RepID=UPI002017946D|nr:TldD/PmbA family protein [Deinococcus sp. QL22]UQN08651.1 TldD/PmbA family protein [Deinococcus sp. QL22]
MLEPELVADVLHAARSGGAEWAELFVEDTWQTNLTLLQGSVKEAGGGNLYGAGLRLLYGTKVVYGYTNDTSRRSLLDVAQALAKSQGTAGVTGADGSGGLNFRRPEAQRLWAVRDHPEQVSKSRKLDIARRAHAAAQTGHVKTTDVTYLDVSQRVLVANTDGDWAEDERVRSRLMVRAIAEDGTARADGYAGPGASQGLEFFEGELPEHTGAEAARLANAMLHAGYAPAGKMPVVIGNGFGGVIFHEACGHILETTAVAKNASVFADKLGQKIAGTCVSAVDDGTVPGAWGSLHTDDEATPSERTLLIDRGVLTSFMVDRVGERQTGYRRTGSGRRQNYTFAPASRMRNTFILAGEDTPEHLISQVEFGLYARTMGGGSVTPGTGDYNFTVNEGYLIRNGQIMEPVRGAALVGNGAQDLLNITGVAGDLACGQGMCGSISGSIPTDVGQPHLLISELTVGGR